MLTDVIASEDMENASAIFTKERLQHMHQLAYVYYKNQCYPEAEALFSILVHAASENNKFWKGLGACLQMKKCYQAALKCYEKAGVLQPDAYLDIHSSDCHFALGQTEAGLKKLSEARQKALQTDDKKILKHVAFMRSRWKLKVNQSK